MDQVIRDGKGIVYRTQTHAGVTKVYDAHNKLLGWCQNGVTRDASGKVVAWHEVPGLLVR
jgi:hypothetical protein